MVKNDCWEELYEDSKSLTCFFAAHPLIAVTPCGATLNYQPCTDRNLFLKENNQAEETASIISMSDRFIPQYTYVKPIDSEND